MKKLKIIITEPNNENIRAYPAFLDILFCLINIIKTPKNVVINDPKNGVLSSCIMLKKDAERKNINKYSFLILNNPNMNAKREIDQILNKNPNP